jgi:uncharacterized protein YciI
MSNDVSISFGTDADKLKLSLEALSGSVLALNNSLSTAAGQFTQFNDRLGEMEKGAEKAAQAQKQTWSTLAQGVNDSLEIVKKGVAVLQKSFAYLREGADIAEIGQSFKAATRSMGQDSEAMMSVMRKATRNQVSDVELMQSAITAMKTGAASDTETLGKLFEIADAKGDLFGLSLTESFDKITRAIAKGEKEAFITLDLLPRRLLDASNSADLLKNRTQLLYEVLRHGEKDVNTLSKLGTTSSDSFNQLEASIKNLNDAIKKDLSGSLMPLVEYVKTDALPIVKSAFELLGESIATLKDINDATGILNSTLAVTTGYIAGMAVGKMVAAFVELAKAIKAAEVAQAGLNGAMLANPMGLKVAAIVLGIYAAKVKADEISANDYAAQKAAELETQGVAGKTRAELVRLEERLRQLKNDYALVDADIKNTSKEWVKFQESRVATPVFGKDENDRFIASIEKLTAKQGEYKNEINKAEDALKGVRDRLKEIESTQQKIIDAKALAGWGAELAGLTSENLADRMMGFSVGGLYSGSFAESKKSQDLENQRTAEKEREKSIKRLKELQKQIDIAFAGRFGITSSNLPNPEEQLQTASLERVIKLTQEAGMAAMGFATGLDKLNPELGKFLDEMKELSDSGDKMSAVEDALRNIAGLDFSKVAKDIGFLSDIPATVTTLAMMNQLSGGLMAAPGRTPVKQESAAAQMMYAASGGLIGDYGRNVFEQQFKTRFAYVKDAAKDVKNEFSDAIATAITEGFTRADFSGFAQSLGAGISSIVSGALGDTISSVVNQKNMGSLTSGNGLFKPIYTKNSSGKTSLNWGNLGTNLAIGAGVSFLTSPGRLFGGRVVKGEENFNTSASLNDQVNQAKELRDQLFLQVGITDATRQLLSEAEFYYTWVRKTKSGNGITSKKTTTYLLEGSGQAQASINKIKELQETVLGEEAQRSLTMFQVSRDNSIRALEMAVWDTASAMSAVLARNPDYDGTNSPYKYSLADRTAMQQSYEQSKIDLINAKESARSGLFSSFLGDANLASLLNSGGGSASTISSMLLGDMSVAGNSKMIQMMQPLLEKAGYQNYNLAKAFSDAGDDPAKQLAAYREQQTILESALTTFEQLAADAKAESLNTSLSTEQQAASFERWQEAFNSFLSVQQQIEENTRTIADIEKQNMLDNITDKISDALTVIGEFIDQKGGDRFIAYRQPMTKEELLGLLKELYATKDPEKYAVVKEIIDDTNDLSLWGG